MKEIARRAEKEHDKDMENLRGMSDKELQEKFAEWYHKKNNAKRTCCLVGIRTQESLNRWRAIHSDKNYKKYNSINWTKKICDDVYNAYPIYDWLTDDVWIANAKFDWDYNKLYTLFFQAGMPIGQMRVASPFNNCAMESLHYYKVIDPQNWGKMIGRVNGVNFSGIYGGTTAMGWKNIKLPDGYTWQKYMEFLLSTLPKDAEKNYREKLDVSIKFWKEKGGVLSKEITDKLTELKIPHVVCEKNNYKTNNLPVRMEYLDDIDIAEFSDLPTYKRMCIAIMKNDHTCKTLGFSATKNETKIRKAAEDKYRGL